MEIVIGIVYVVAGYWAVGKVLYKNKIVIEFQPGTLFFFFFSLEICLGLIFIPVAIIKSLIQNAAK